MNMLITEHSRIFQERATKCSFPKFDIVYTKTLNIDLNQLISRLLQRFVSDQLLTKSSSCLKVSVKCI